jgi:cytochrome c biogenesis protein CcdA
MEARIFLKDIKNQYPQIIFKELEVVKDNQNKQLFFQKVNELDIQMPGVPLFVFRKNYEVGFTGGLESEEQRILSMIEKQLQEKQPPGAEYTGTGAPMGRKGLIMRIITKRSDPEGRGEMIAIPRFGEVNPRLISLPLFTFFIGLIDGINPCALWVLMFLLTLLVNAQEKKKIVIVGTVFVATSALVYLVFMIAWLNVFTFMGISKSVTIGLGIIVIIVGLINVKELFLFKRGVSLMIPEKAKPKLYTKMRGIMENPNTLLSVAGTVSLAFFVNLIEFGCTVGLPAVYTRVLSIQRVSSLKKYLYMVFYNVSYVIPLLVVVFIFVFTMEKYRLQEKHGKVLKIISGSLMLVLGFILVFNPHLLVFS